MFLLPLRETLSFFWQQLTELLWRLTPLLLPLLLLTNYRYVMIHHGDPEAAMKDMLALLPQLLCGVAASAFTITYALSVEHKQAASLPALWLSAFRRLPALLGVQMLMGVLLFTLPVLLVVGGGQLSQGALPAYVPLLLMLLMLPVLYLLGALLPSYVFVVHERQHPVAALKTSWGRFREQAWAVSAGLCFLMMILLIVLSGLGQLEALLEFTPAITRVLALSMLDLIGMLFAQMVTIMLVRFYLQSEKTVKSV
jgi:hypothetical protein